MRVVEVDIAQQGGLEVSPADELVALQHLLDAPVEAFDHAVGLRMHRRCQAMFDTEVGAKLIELVPAGGAAFAQQA